MKQIKTKAMVTKIANKLKKEIENELACYNRKESKYEVKVSDVCEGIKKVVVKRKGDFASIGNVPAKDVFEAYQRVAGDYVSTYCTVEAYTENGEPMPMIVCGVSIDII